MSKPNYKIQLDSLVYQEGPKTVAIIVGTPEWFGWLAQATSFSYSSEAGNFTARKELSGSNHKGWYWKAYRKSGGKLYRSHLGKDSALTAEHLSLTAKKLAGKIQLPLVSDGKGKQVAVAASWGEEVLIATKLHIPQNRKTFTRPRLLDHLKHTANARLVLVSAPPGFGKTTLIAEWLQAQKEVSVGWFSIDEADNDTARFWRYFIQAFPPGQRQAGTDFPPGLSLDHRITYLLNRLAETQEELYLVLDDYHLISNREIEQKLAYFLDHMSECCHLIIITRTDPALPLARLRFRNQLIELKAADLRLTAEEISHYLTTVMRLPLSPAQITTLEERTEGWIGALQMLALSLQGRAIPEQFIASFSGAHQHLFDFLTEEVLLKQTPEVQTFLFKSSILERINAELVQEVTGCPSGQSFLESLEQVNLFLIGLDEKRDWFRYHTLFKEYLYKRLTRTCPQEISALHNKAAHWYARQKNFKEAIQHFLLAEAWEEAAALIVQTAQSILMQGETFTLTNWLSRLPAMVYRQQPGLYLVKTLVFITNGQLGAAEELLQSSLNEVGIEESERVAIQTLLALLRWDLTLVFDLAGPNLENLPHHTLFWRDIKLLAKGAAASLQGNSEQASRTYRRALQTSRKNGNILVAMLAQGQLGDLLLQRGELQAAASIYKEVLNFTSQLLNSQANSAVWLGPTYQTLFEALYELNKFEEAAHYVAELSQLAQKYDAGLLFIFSQVLAARSCFMQGLAGRALEIIQGFELDSSYDNTVRAKYIELYRVQILIACNERSQVQEWLQAQDVALSSTSKLQLHAIVLGQAFNYLHCPDEALAVLLPCLENALRKKQILTAIRAYIGQAVAYYKKRLLKEALENLEQALELARPNEIIRSFVDSDGCVELLLVRLKNEPHSRVELNFINKLLKVFAQKYPERSIGLPGNISEPLTERELEILRLLESGLSNQELATRLVISAGTVAWHLKNLYAKLSVHNRTEALSQARKLNLF